MGQHNTRGAYPFHWHMVGDAPPPNNYIVDSSVYRYVFCVVGGGWVDGGCACR